MKRTGQIIAAVGNNEATAGPHLHFQLIFRLGPRACPTSSIHSCSSDTSTRRPAGSYSRRPSPTPSDYPWRWTSWTSGIAA